jgi:adenylate cyclase
MPLEIERKFLVNSDKWTILHKPDPELIRQGYLLTDVDKTIRVRLKGEKGFITIKGKTTGAVRDEYEYEIPVNEAHELLDKFAVSELFKRRYEIEYSGKTWEVDLFEGVHQGLILAEIELSSESETFEKPDWVGEEVTGDVRYYNSYLAGM